MTVEFTTILIDPKVSVIYGFIIASYLCKYIPEESHDLQYHMIV